MIERATPGAANDGQDATLVAGSPPQVAGQVDGHRPRSRIAARWPITPTRYGAVTHLMGRHSLAATRLALGLVYVWFGALKLGDATPVASLVRGSIPFVKAPAWVVPALGVIEIIIGIALLVGNRLALLLPLFLAHMLGTFSVLVVQPAVAFRHSDPLLLSVTGEFVVKNLVLLAAGVAVCTSADRRQSMASAMDLSRPPSRTAGLLAATDLASTVPPVPRPVGGAAEHAGEKGAEVGPPAR